jgi:hypothetical protein
MESDWDEIARKLQEIFSDRKLRYSARRLWRYHPELQAFVRDPLDLELEKDSLRGLRG